ncbi:MAG TPA: hypothetical protein P5117_15355, partial [Spirochaetia bacterium]|nr:hypothetical protein [Spirochaetia bacterium]
MKSVELSWSASELGSAFQSYQVVRSPDNAVNANDIVIGTFTATNQTSMTDSNLLIGATYYYWVNQF